jgi:hypothetical protein
MSSLSSLVIAYDGSGSTSGNEFYHDQTQRIVSQYPDATILFWDSSHRLISHDELKVINKNRSGYDGTSPERIALWVKTNNFHGRIIIITDGMVSESSVDRCALEFGSDWTFESVEAHLIGSSVNMSVTCPFTRASSHSVYLYEPKNDYEQVLTTNVSKDDFELLNQIDHISSVDEFQAIAPKLESVLVARTMGTNGNMELRDKLLAMKKRINFSIASTSGNSDATKDFVAALRCEPRNYGDAVRSARQLTAEYYRVFDESDVSGSTWSSKLSRMIAMTEGALRGVFSMNAITSGIQSDRIRRAAAAPVSAIPNHSSTTSSATAEEPFVCPITLDVEHDLVLLVKKGEPILAGVEKRIVDDLLDCPLNLLKYSELIDQVIARLDMTVSLSAFDGAMKTLGGWERSPTTRDPILPGAICFGAAPDHRKATQWTLAQLFTGGKLAGNPDFWFATLWLILKRTDLCPEYLHMLEPHARAHMTWRLTHSNTFIGLSGLPEFPTTYVPLDCAIWYVLASPLFADEFGTAGRDVLRGHLPHLTQLLELAALAKLDIPNELQSHYSRLKTMLRYLAWIKTDRFTLPMYTRMLVQAHTAINPLDTTAKDAPKYVPIDGPPSASQILEARTALRADPALTLAELVGIAGLVSPQKSASDIPMPINIRFEEPVMGRVDWLYGLGSQLPFHVTISPATCRPLYMYGEETWRDQSIRKYGPIEKQISVHAYYGKYVQTYNAFPTRTDLLVFIYMRCVTSGKHSTLPAPVVQIIDEVCDDYAPIVATMDPVEFNARYKASVRIEDRIRIERSEKA